MLKIYKMNNPLSMKNFLAFCGLVAVFAHTLCFAEDHTTMLPAETLAYVSVDSWDTAVQLWDNPRFIPIAAEDRRFQDLDFADQFGLTIETFGTLASGRVTRAMVSPDALIDGTTVIIADVDSEAVERWKKEVELKPVQDNLFSLSFFNAKEQSATAFFLFTEEQIAFSQHQQPLADMAGQLASSSRGSSLANEKAFVEAGSRLLSNPDEEGVHFEWFSRPWLNDVEKTQTGGSKNVKNEFHRHGFDAVFALAGCVQQKNDSTAGTTSITVLAEPPYRSTLGIFTPVSTPAVSVPNWAFKTGRDGIVMQLDFRSAMENIATLFDDAFAEGIEGTYRDLLADIKAEDGMGLDLDKELFAKLGPKLIYLGDIKNKSWLAAIEVADAKHVAEVVRLLVEDDPDVTGETLQGTDNPLWKIAATKDTPEWYLHVSDKYLFSASRPDGMTAAGENQSSEDMDQWFKEVLALPGSSESRDVVGLAWTKPDQADGQEYSAANTMRGWFLGNYRESKTWWERESRNENFFDFLPDTPTTSRTGSRGVAFQENHGGWTFYWQFQ